MSHRKLDGPDPDSSHTFSRERMTRMSKHELNLTRCDRCPAASVHDVFFEGSEEPDLKFCDHHFKANEDALRASGAMFIHDLLEEEKAKA